MYHHHHGFSHKCAQDRRTKKGGLFDLVGVAQNKSTICFYKNRSFAASSFLYFLSFKIFFVSFQIKVSVKDQSLLKARPDTEGCRFCSGLHQSRDGKSTDESATISI